MWPSSRAVRLRIISVLRPRVFFVCFMVPLATALLMPARRSGIRGLEAVAYHAVVIAVTCECVGVTIEVPRASCATRPTRPRRGRAAGQPLTVGGSGDRQ